ncbi:MAG: ATP-dependent DNA helicase RecG [Clostridiales bacterium]|nr:ATP-dependent DNA helicase RecG [Clostridiales bacterium]
MELNVLKGLGPKRIESLNKLDIFCVEDLVSYLPITYRDLTVISKINAAAVDTPSLFKVRVLQRPIVKYPRKNFSITTCEIEDVSGKAQAIWFNQPYIAKNIKENTDVFLYGSIEIKQGKRRLMNPSIEHEDELQIVPVYRLPLSSSLNQKSMRSIMKQAIQYCANNEPEVFDDDFRIKHKLALRKYAIKNIHFPENNSALLASKRRLSFEELINIQLYIKLRKKQNEKEAGKVFDINEQIVIDFVKKLPYKLTSKQIKAIKEIYSDVTSGKAMNRLVQGDVGCGKTIVAFISMLFASINGGQSALMAPTEILARQHYLQLIEFFGEDNVCFLSGSLSVAEKREVLDKIKSGQAKFIVGTNALIQKSVIYNNLLLVICDEQHRFGVKQRAKLFNKGNSPHTLVMSATPIPRTLSLIVFGDLDISIIDEMPAGRKKVSTSVITKSREADMLKYIRNELLQGRQAYFVCPLIEEDEESTLISAEGLFEELNSGYLSDIPIALMHGKMSAEEKNKVMDAFNKGEIKALISTTVIEVGVNVKNATIMVIYGCDRFGLSQLHQLRGRVGRGELQSYCFLLTESQNENTFERLTIMAKNSNGFDIAQFDYEMRGPGDYLGKRQSGIAEARFSYALSNTLLLKETQTVLNNEILPQIEKYDFLIKCINEKFDRELEDIAYN